ncbi:HD domain-containing protein [uncultured Robinsoniella sp.]|uniref:HD domain-containing protein n=1 Tax=uncultured Robinsoniella sp. TaxID=904190 RepID=UPI00374EFE33
MIDFKKAKEEFEKYLDDYDRNNDKINLKIIHTYGVMDYSEKVAGRMHLSQEDIDLAKIIALLHDIGRFEQLKRYDSFQPDTMDHASYGEQILFDKGMIRRFAADSRWDGIIRTAIAHHSDFALKGIDDPRTLLHSKLIRDADKLDNCRVKLEESIPTLLGATPAEVGLTSVSPAVAESFFRNESILSSDRKTLIDYWISYLAYFFDINFKESLQIIEEHQFISRIIKRIPYKNPATCKIMGEMERTLNEFVKQACL